MLAQAIGSGSRGAAFGAEFRGMQVVVFSPVVDEAGLLTAAPQPWDHKSLQKRLSDMLTVRVFGVGSKPTPGAPSEGALPKTQEELSKKTSLDIGDLHTSTSVKHRFTKGAESSLRSSMWAVSRARERHRGWLHVGISNQLFPGLELLGCFLEHATGCGVSVL